MDELYSVGQKIAQDLTGGKKRPLVVWALLRGRRLVEKEKKPWTAVLSES